MSLLQDSQVWSSWNAHTLAPAPAAVSTSVPDGVDEGKEEDEGESG